MAWNPLVKRFSARLREENALLRAEAAELRAEQSMLRAEAELPHPVVSELLAIADRLTELTKEGGAPADAAQAAAALRWLDGRLSRLLSACDVADVHDEGPVDPARHHVVGVRPADDGRPVGSIAETVRRGYAWHGHVLRHQQVIVYVEPDPD
ncbi:nucleotide exchange factor GrpE [Streptomyces sp. LX-29]|uniref:nucleotide exchange factor GrpE n=1 Tax=Streptomyces sp. LX-29 TaxID=2900152 RepID=UPI00240DCE2C|nr:nucleotide exchange factor GrpE [Streptomyces sp. LX-29]WFB11040.1 nucleotide exchange factor GrpE [Streptomyces sp. LX-29]